MQTILKFVAIIFGILIVVQIVCKQAGLPTPSRGLAILRDLSIHAFSAIGEFLGRWLNIHYLIENVLHYLRQIWDFIKEHVWKLLKPVVEAIDDVTRPMIQLIFSPIYFFVGFAKSHYLFFSYVGFGLLISCLIWYFNIDLKRWGDWFVHPNFVPFSTVSLSVCIIGTLYAYPHILPDLFPRIYQLLNVEV
jgi:hypothetical protein